MSFNKCIVQKLSKIKEQHSELGDDKFKQIYKRYDMFVGSTESIDFINNILSK